MIWTGKKDKCIICCGTGKATDLYGCYEWTCPTCNGSGAVKVYDFESKKEEKIYNRPNLLIAINFFVFWGLVLISAFFSLKVIAIIPISLTVFTIVIVKSINRADSLEREAKICLSD